MLRDAPAESTRGRTMTGVDGSTSEGRAPRDRGQLESLVGQALDELRERTAAGEGDVGVALVELLAWVSDFLSCYSDRLADEAHLASGAEPTRALSRLRLGILTPALRHDRARSAACPGAHAERCLVVRVALQNAGHSASSSSSTCSADPSRSGSHTPVDLKPWAV
jgi:hypothetical protein